MGGGGGGWLEKLGIRLSQLPTKLKLKLKLSLAIIQNAPYTISCYAVPKVTRVNNSVFYSIGGDVEHVYFVHCATVSL